MPHTFGQIDILGKQGTHCRHTLFCAWAVQHPHASHEGLVRVIMLSQDGADAAHELCTPTGLVYAAMWSRPSLLPDPTSSERVSSAWQGNFVPGADSCYGAG